MRYNPPQTVDISAEPIMPFASPPPQVRSFRLVIRQTIGVDIFLLFISLLTAVLFSSAIGVMDGTNDLGTLMLRPPRWFLFFACAIVPGFYLFIDGLSALSNPRVLPFARSQAAMKAIYAKRIHLLLLAFYFIAILVALCWSAPSMVLASKFFVAAVFAIALYALGQSIPSRRLSFIVSGILFLVVLIATQTFIVFRLEAEASRANKEALGDVVPSDDLPGAIEPPKNSKDP